MSEPKCSEGAQALVDNFGDAISVDEYEPTLDTARDVDKTYDSLTEFIATLEHRNAALERVAEAAMDVEPPCDYYVFSGHDREDEHREDCAACELKDALRALDGEDK